MKKTAVIIGATGGIGSSLVKALSDEYTVIAVSRSGEFACDLTSYIEINHVISKIKTQVQTIDLLVHAAGIGTYKPILLMTDQDIQAEFMINTIAPAIFSRELVSLMNHDGALVLSLGSGAGVTPMKERSIYCASKFALRGLSLSLRREYADKKPHFCLITLGSTLTNFGSMTVEEKQKAAANGKAYFPVDWLVKELVKIIHDSDRDDEIELYPSEHGFGE